MGTHVVSALLASLALSRGSKLPDRPGGPRSRPEPALGHRRPPGAELTASEREQEILELSWKLQRERVRTNSVLRRWWVAQHAPRVVVVANRLPLQVKRGPGGTLEYSVTSGGMVSALLGIKHVRMVWVGWADIRDTTPAERDQIRRAMWARGCVPVFIEQDMADLYYNGYCNGVLWPLVHYVISSTSPQDAGGGGGLHPEQWEAYQAVNARFSEVVQQIVRRGDMVWAHDHHHVTAMYGTAM